ncbi:MAG: sigma-70 family RNA polymerase sigma factor [Verrucomicrobiota bacterium]
MPIDSERQAQFTRQFAACERAMQAFAFSLVPNRADVDDIIQETLKALWEKFDEYDPNQPFLPWANRFVYRQVQMHRRKQAIRHKYVFSDDTFEKLASDEPVSLEHDRAMAAALDTCLKKLGSKNRELIERRYLAGAPGSLQDYADETQQTPNALYKKLQRIREILHRCITQRLEREGFTA